MSRSPASSRSSTCTPTARRRVESEAAGDPTARGRGGGGRGGCDDAALSGWYRAGTWGKAHSNHSATNFGAVYRRRLRARNALTCFISGATLCDSVGAVTPRVLGGAALRRARFNLLHRFAFFGLTERAEESQLIIAWALGWLGFYLEQAGSAKHRP